MDTMEEGTEHVLSDIGHRINQLEKTAHFVHETHHGHKETIVEQKELFASKIKFMKDDLEDVRELCRSLAATIHTLGRELKTFATRDEIDLVRERIDERNYSDFITRNELKNTYDFYSKDE